MVFWEGGRRVSYISVRKRDGRWVSQISVTNKGGRWVSQIRVTNEVGRWVSQISVTNEGGRWVIVSVSHEQGWTMGQLYKRVSTVGTGVGQLG